MRRNVKAEGLSAVALASIALLSASSTLAQSGEDTLWLECRETSRGQDTYTAGFANDFFAVGSNSIVSYKRQSSGNVDRWGDLCERGSSTCRINADEIFARFSVPAGEYFFKVDRRTGLLEVTRYSDGEEAGFWVGQCRRATDPRPPAAF